MHPTRLSAASILLCLLATPLLAEAPEAAPVPPEVPETLREEAEDGAAEDAPEDAAEAPVGEETEPEPADEAAEAPEETPVPPEAPEGLREEAEAGGEAEPDGAEAPAEGEDTEAEPAEEAAEETDDAIDNELDEPDEAVVVAPPEVGPSFDPEAAKACEAELVALGVRFERADPLEGDGPCGAPQPLRVSAIGGAELRPEITVRCPAALSLALWIDRVAAPLAKLYMEQEVEAVLTATGYQCRRRRGDGTAKWSEHAFANAIDVSGVMFEDGDTMAIRPREESDEPERSYQAGIRGGACAFFTTVLGPTTNGAHADHLHLDMAERRGGYRLCE